MSTIAQQLTIAGNRQTGQPVRTQNGKKTKKNLEVSAHVKLKL
jgi:hypothetical protein